MSVIGDKVAGLRRRLEEAAARRAVERRWRAGERGRSPPTGEPPLIVSLTSHPPRFATLTLTLKSLLTQTVRPEGVLLWVGRDAASALPREVRALEGDGLSIRSCEDVRSFTKFVHALRAFPHHRIAVCDDDMWYRPHWLAELIRPLPSGRIACHRIHRIRLDCTGRPLSYNDWDQASDATDDSPLNYPTGVGGILLRADLLDPRVTDTALALALCPTADDTWLYWMGRLAGSRFVRVGDNDPLLSWRASQEVALWRANNVADEANNGQLAAMIASFGTGAFHDQPQLAAEPV